MKNSCKLWLVLYVLVGFLVILCHPILAFTNQVTSFTGQSNPFNINLVANQNQSFVLNIPQYSYIKNITLTLVGDTFLSLERNYSYLLGGTWDISPSYYAIDGNWITKATSGWAGPNWIYINYTNLTVRSGAEVWNVKYARYYSEIINLNYTLPVWCNNQTILQFRMGEWFTGVDYPIVGSCYNGTDWSIVFQDTAIVVAQSGFYEQALITNATLLSNRAVGTIYVNNIKTNFNMSTNLSLNISQINSLLSSNQIVNLTFNSNVSGTLQVNLTNASYYFNLDNCTLTENYSINYTIKDETTNNPITATTTGIYNYTIDGTNFYTYTLNQPSTNNFSICVFPNWAIVTSYTTLYSSSGSDYPQRRFYSTDTLTNLTQSKTLTLLNSSTGIYVRFKTTDSYNNVIAGVNIKAYKSSDLFTTIEEENTDDSGIATFFLNPNQDYYFIITKTGYSIFTSTLRATTSEIIGIILTSSGAVSAISYSSGISYYYTPENTQLEANTLYNFTFNLNSDYWDITGCTLYLALPNSTILNSSSSSFDARKCGIQILYNTSDYESIVGYSIYELNHTINVTETASVWNVNQYSYSNYTFMTIIQDINNLVNSNVGGLSSSTIKLIVFFIIFGLVAYVSYKFQGTALTSPESITIFIVVLVWLFSLLGWLTLDYFGLNFVNAGQNHTVAWLKQYIIAILLTVLGGAFVYRRYKYG